jgi:hypothetical protein
VSGGTESIANLVDDGAVVIASGSRLDVSSAVDPSSTGLFQLQSTGALFGTNLKIQFQSSDDFKIGGISS